ncbi:protein kinase [Microbispora hainanensis]|uniref:serine/threonine-protein kinase n=1 Tax=Microbispora hainanensis TaxID=568844 RepID=UPI002E28D8FD|nr:protein kinase [Microbispora hainanensis]
MRTFETLREDDPQQVGPFRIEARLGEGGMGRVYFGRSRSGRAVAVKVVRPELAGDADFRRRFDREIATARKVNGFFTAGVVDADPQGSPPWLATAYVPGLSLEDAVDEHGPWPEESVLALAAGLAEALESIHAAGVVHRDLKPSNVLLADDGPRVIDFGISLAAEGGSLTKTGITMGSPGFMSPEQLKGTRVGPASDVFCLGLVLAFAATGSGPFGQGSWQGLWYRIVHEEPALDGLPPAVRPLVARCLAKEPEERPTVSAVLNELAGSGRDFASPIQQGRWLPPDVAQAVRTRVAPAVAPTRTLTTSSETPRSPLFDGPGAAAPGPATPAGPGAAAYGPGPGPMAHGPRTPDEPRAAAHGAVAPGPGTPGGPGAAAPRVVINGPGMLDGPGAAAYGPGMLDGPRRGMPGPGTPRGPETPGAPETPGVPGTPHPHMAGPLGGPRAGGGSAPPVNAPGPQAAFPAPGPPYSRPAPYPAGATPHPAGPVPHPAGAAPYSARRPAQPYAPQVPPAPGPRRPRRYPAWLRRTTRAWLVLCVLLVAVAAVCEVGMGISATPRRISSDGSALTVTLNPTLKPAIYVSDASPDPRCRVENGSGRNVRLVRPAASYRPFTTSDTKWRLLYEIRPPKAGSYTVTCSGDDTVFGVGAAPSPGTRGISAAAVALLVLLAVFGAPTLLVVALITRKRRPAS